MNDFVRFHGSGRVNQVEERFTVRERGFTRLWLGIGGDAAKSESVIQIDFYDELERKRALALPRGTRVLVLGRVSGKVNEKGYWNGTLFGDAVYADTRNAHAPGGGGVKVRRPVEPEPEPSGESSDDIPF